MPNHKTRSYAYCSDTSYTESIIPIVNGVDVLYHESTFLKDMEDRAKTTFHSTAHQAATIAKKANVELLLLGHYSARYKSSSDFEIEAKEIFENVKAVEDGDLISIAL